MPMVPSLAAQTAKTLRVPFVRDRKLPLWTGRAVNLAHVFNDAIYTPSNIILHELAHYVLSPEKYRHLPNFGWYDTPGGPSVEANYGAKDRLNEERTAQVLTYLTMRSLGLGWVRACESDGWTEDEVLKFGSVTMAAKGLVDPFSLRPYLLDGKIVLS